ncbi:hypothetical protein M885DRAFT_507204 [Pelagophyceae sp. CCMP2097]|nr:hypothetical protein M885DRAFT_507204 [Pelagophyceae sp. CCMP2097]
MSSSLAQTLTLDHVSPATRLLEKRRQMFEVQEALDAQKEEYLRHEDAFRRREEALRKKDVELQDSLIKFNKFLQENESKRKRAVTRAADERKQREQKEGEIGRLQAQRELKIQDAKLLEKDLQRNKVCQEFLTDVCAHLAEDYHEIQDLLNRHKTLRGANDDLSRRQKNHEDLSEEKKDDFSKYVKERANEMLNANNEVASLRDKLEATESTTYRLQGDVDSAIRGLSDKTLELCQVLAAVDNLLERFVRHMRSHKQSREPVEKKVSNAKQPAAKSAEELEIEGRLAMDRLDEIAAYMIDYNDICADYDKWKPLQGQTRPESS